MRGAAAPGVLIVLLALASCSISCPKRTPDPDPTLGQLTTEQAWARLGREAARRQRLSGLYKAKLGGLKGLVFSADLDVATEMPDRLHLAVRSFFGQPLQVLATHDGRVTLYDSQAPDGPGFYEGQADQHTASMLLGVPLSVPEVVDAFLGRAPRDASPLAVAQADDGSTYTLVLSMPDGGRATLVAGTDDVIRSLEVEGPGARPRYKLAYDDVEERDGIPFATSAEVTVARPDGDKETLELEVKELQLNPEPFDPLIFEVGLPPGESFSPLGGRVQTAPLGGRRAGPQPGRRTARGAPSRP